MMPRVTIFSPTAVSPFVKAMERKYRSVGLIFRWLVNHRLWLAREVDELHLPYDHRERLVQLLDTLTEWQVYDLRLLYRSYGVAAGIFIALCWNIPILLACLITADQVGRFVLTLIFSVILFLTSLIISFKLVGDNRTNQQWRNQIDHRIQRPYHGDRVTLLRDLGILRDLDPDTSSNIHAYYRAILREQPTAE
jgi:hypothetical protein